MPHSARRKTPALPRCSTERLAAVVRRRAGAVVLVLAAVAEQHSALEMGALGGIEGFEEGGRIHVDAVVPGLLAVRPADLGADPPRDLLAAGEAAGFHPA